MNYTNEIKKLKESYEKEQSSQFMINRDAYENFLKLADICSNWHDKEAEISYQFDPEQYDGEFIITSIDLFLEDEKDIINTISKVSDYINLGATEDASLCIRVGVKNVWFKLI